MNLSFDLCVASHYSSKTQIARVLTENWIQNNMYCPRCGNMQLSHFNNNKPVADFFCESCANQYELKGKNGTLGNKVADGAYDTMIKRITSNTNPDFFFMSYSKAYNRLTDLVIVPKYFFVPDIIEKRKPLAASARRAGWVGCNILFGSIPKQGRISIIENGKETEPEKVIKAINGTRVLETSDITSRGWLMDTLTAVNTVKSEEFCLKDIYDFEHLLSVKHPDNHHIKDKIRQQLQILRDKELIQFIGPGRYKKIGMIK